MEPVAYTYEADIHCPACTKKRFGETWRVSVFFEHPLPRPPKFTFYEAAEDYIRQHGGGGPYGPFIAEDAEDNEGNPVGAVFAWETEGGPESCGSCGEVLWE